MNNKSGHLPDAGTSTSRNSLCFINCSGRTQHQARHSQEINRAPPDFERVSSKRFSSKVLDGKLRTNLEQGLFKGLNSIEDFFSQ